MIEQTPTCKAANSRNVCEGVVEYDAYFDEELCPKHSLLAAQAEGAAEAF